MISGGFFEFLDNTNLSSSDNQNKSYIQFLEKLKKQAHTAIEELPDHLKVCKNFWKQAVFYSPEENIKILPKCVKNDIIFWQNILSENPDILEYCPSFIKENHNLVFYALSQDPTIIRFAGKLAVIEILKMDASFSQYLPDALKDDEQIILASVKRRGLNLQFASDRLKSHKDVVHQAILSNGLALQYAHKRFRMSEEFVMLAARQNPQALAFMHSELKSKQAFILNMLKSTTLVLKYVTFLQDDEVFIKKAVAVNGLCLEFVSERLKNNDDVVLGAIYHNPKALKFASSRLKDTEHIVLEAVSKNGLCLAFVSKRLKACESIVYKAVNQNGMALQYADAELKKIKDIVIPACRKDGRALVFAHPQLKKIRSVVLSAVNQNGLALKHAFKDLKRYQEIVMMALSQNGGAIRYASGEFTSIDFYVEFAILSNPRALNHVNKRFISQKEVIKKILKKDPYLFDKIDPLLKIDKPFLQELLNSHHVIFDRLSLEIKKDHTFLSKIRALKVLSKEQKVELLSLTNEEVKYAFIGKLIEAFNFGKLENSSLNKDIYHAYFSSCKNKSLLPVIHQLAIRTWGPSSLCEFTPETTIKMKQLQEVCLEDLQTTSITQLYFSFLARLEKFNVSRAKKFEIYHAVMTSDKNYRSHLLTLVPIIWHLGGYHKLVQLGLYNYEKIKSYLLDHLLEHNILNHREKEVFIEGLSLVRLPYAIFAYAHNFILDEIMKEPLKHLCHIVARTKKLSDFKNIHLLDTITLSLEKKQIWQNDSSSYEHEPIDLRSYFKAYLIRQDFNGDDNRAFHSKKINLDLFKQALLDKASYQRQDEETIESLLIKMIAPETTDKLALIEKALNLLEGHKHEAIYHVLVNLKDRLLASYFVSVSSQWQDLFLCGTEVGGSSQRVCGDPQFTRCLISYCFNPLVKVICVKTDQEGPIKARAILKLMQEESLEGKKYCLLMERCYPRAIVKEHEILLFEKAKQVAKLMQLDLFMIKPEKNKEVLFSALAASNNKQEIKKITSLGPMPLCPFEYSDVGYGITRGSYVINALKIDLNKNSEG